MEFFAAFKAAGGELDQYLIAGPDISRVVERYTELTGRMAMPPRWSLGYHQCRHSYYPEAEVLEIADELRTRGFPADGLWLDIDYMDEFRVWTWSPTDFPDPEAMIQTLRDQGFRTVVIIDPAVKEEPSWPVYASGLDDDLYLTEADGSPYVGVVWPEEAVYPDFTNPATRAWWAGLVPTMTDVGVDGLWTDMNEPADFATDTHTVPDHVLAHGEGHPTTMMEAHNVYGSTMAQATRQGLVDARPDERPFVLTRAGYAGVQREAAVWTGDAPSTWDALQQTVPTATMPKPLFPSHRP